MLIASFLGAFLGGTSVTLFLAVLAGQGQLPPSELAIGAALGNLSSDFLWFMVGKSKRMLKWTSKGRFQRGYERVQRLAEVHKQQDLAIFILVKFLYGLRVITIIFFGRMRYSLKRFIVLDTAAVLIITASVIAAGWAAGKGASIFLDIFDGIRLAFTATVVGWLLFMVVRKLVRHYFLPEESNRP
ncbi:MAG: hypothetical protein HN337_04700 [Deltaproteobacteria bacterium]|nr:hypothetical protein [Deltaproteobacteria bacterium]